MEKENRQRPGPPILTHAHMGVSFFRVPVFFCCGFEGKPKATGGFPSKHIPIDGHLAHIFFRDKPPVLQALAAT